MTKDDSTKEGDSSRSPAEKYAGKPCRRCGGTERYRSTQSCVTCTAMHGKKWLAAHPGAATEIERRYLARHPEARERRLQRQRERRARLKLEQQPTTPPTDPQRAAEIKERWKDDIAAMHAGREMEAQALERAQEQAAAENPQPTTRRRRNKAELDV